MIVFSEIQVVSVVSSGTAFGGAALFQVASALKAEIFVHSVPHSQ